MNGDKETDMLNDILIRLGIRTWRRGLSFAAGFGMCFGGGMLLTEGGCSGALGAECMLDSDCEGGRICIYQFCHVQCRQESDCIQAGANFTCMVGPKSEREVPNYCAERKACTKTVQCGSGRVCIVEPNLSPDAAPNGDAGADGGICEDACTTSNECVDGKVCYMGFCTKEPDPDAGERLPDIVPAGTGQPCKYHSDCESMNCGYRGLCVGCRQNDDCGCGRICNVMIAEGKCCGSDTPACGSQPNGSSTSSGSSGISSSGAMGTGGTGGAGNGSSGSSGSMSSAGSTGSGANSSSTSSSGGVSSSGGMPCSGDRILLNEIDYDQDLTDNAEFVELLNPTCETLTLDGLALIFINGANSTRGEYGRATLSGTLGAGQMLVVATPGDAMNLPAMNSNGSVVFSPLTFDIQNSCEGGTDCADVVALVDLSTLKVIDGLFYEGDPWALKFAPLTGGSKQLDLADANSTLETDENTSESISICRKPNGGSWVKCQQATPGEPNKD